jgi:release factor glutamine methyltransferase
MMTYKEAEENLATDLLQLYDRRESSQLSTWVLESITGKNKSERLVAVGREMNEKEIEGWRQIKDKLLKGEPIQYVLNEAPFMQWNFSVNPSTLIPRPETEQLVEWILRDHSEASTKKVFDAGTGSGCIAIALKAKRPFWQIIAADKSEGALATAQVNAQKIGVNVSFIQMDLLDESLTNWPEGLELIVSNPPYIPLSERSEMAKHVVEFEPELALFVPDVQPLVFYEALGKAANKRLLSGGSMYVEINQNFGQAVIDLFNAMDFTTMLLKDFQGNDRLVRAIRG